MERLFSEYDLHRVVEAQHSKVKKAVQELARDEVLGVSETDLVKHLVSRFEILTPTLHKDAMYLEQEETNIDVSRDPGRDVRSGQSVSIPGIRVAATVPFSGEGDLFRCRPNQFNANPPSATLGAGTLALEYTRRTLDAAEIKNAIESDLSKIEKWLGWQRSQAAAFNAGLPRLAQAELEARRNRILETEGALASIGIPVRRRESQSSTFVIPDVKRKPRINVPRPVPSEPFVAEPAIDLETYEEILKIISDMAQVMERSPHAFADLDEESLRFQFLVPLNGHFEGGASGETFNYEGKTDILIKSSGKIVFVAECKFWKGPKALTGTVDQIRTYLSWRDTKAAILLFVRNRDFSGVIDRILPTIESHSGWKKTVGQTGETSFRFLFGHRDDTNREITLSVLLFPVPREETAGSK